MARLYDARNVYRYASFSRGETIRFLTVMKNYTILLLGLLLSACATGHEPQYFYNEILIVNESRVVIQDVTISAEATGRSFNCGNIAPLGICSNKIPQRRYMKSPITLSWVFGNTARQTEKFLLEVPTATSNEFPLRGVLQISPSGSVSAYFEQDTPSI